MLRVLLSAALAAVLAVPAPAQYSGPPEEGGRIRSMEMPPVVQPSLVLSFGSVRPDGGGTREGGYLTGSFYRDLVNPAIKAAGFALEGYVGGREGDEGDGGVRGMLQIPPLRLSFGADWNLKDASLDFVLTFQHPIRRGGLLGHGTELRVDWLPGRGHSFNVGLVVPLAGRQGQTRPRATNVRLRGPGYMPSGYRVTDDALRRALADVRDTAHWVNLLTIPFLDQDGKDRAAAHAAYRARLDEIRRRLATPSPLFARTPHTSEDEVRAYHAALDRAFSIAESGRPLGVGESTGRGRALAEEAKRLLLERVIVPYDRLLGQFKKNDTTEVYAHEVRAIFAGLAERRLAPERVPQTIRVFEEMLAFAEAGRAFNRREWSDSRLVWLPLQWALLPEQHDTQDELDAVLARVTGHGFENGNRLWYVVNEQWQWEVSRMLYRARDYHVLWIHDIRGVDGGGDPDELTFLQLVDGYLGALTEKVRRYDETGELPVYMIFQDQMFFELNESRAALKVLESPLGFRLPREIRRDLGDYAYMADELTRAQAELKAAVAGSHRLQEEARRFGRGWLENRIKVHVNVTNPADATYWSWQFIPVLGVPDVLMRDHRKISFYDVSEEDPYAGMGMYSGMGIGEHYTGATWEDRGVLVQGPALLSLKGEAYALLRSQGFSEDEIPWPLRPRAKAADYEERVRKVIESEGDLLRGMDIHNRIGFGPKPLSVLKAATYSLMPAGSVLALPDHLWTSAFWESMLAGAALRGSRTFVIAPSIESHPASSSGPIQSRSQEILERRILFQEVMGDELRACGGMVKTGIYDHDLDVKDLPGMTRLAADNVAKTPFLQELFDFDPDAAQPIQDALDSLDDFEWGHLFPDADVREAKLHLKVNLAASAEAWRVLAQPAIGEYIAGYLRERARQIQDPTVYTDVRELTRHLRAASATVEAQLRDELTDEEWQRVVFYLTVGSKNQDDRALMLDGEVAFVAAGPNATVGLMDVVFLMAQANWCETLEQLEEYLPTYDNKTRKLGRFISVAI